LREERKSGLRRAISVFDPKPTLTSDSVGVDSVLMPADGGDAMKRAVLAVAVVVALGLAGTLIAQTDPAKVERPVWPPAGSTWTVRLTSTGSLGSGSQDGTFRALGEVDWDGRRVMGIANPSGVHLYFDASRRIVAQVRDGKPIQTYDPYEALYEWPLFVGKSWVSDFRVRDYARDTTTSLRYDFRVEAIEEIIIPAGAFKTFRIRRDSPDDRYVIWFDPELGLEVKRDWERFTSHRLGSGTNQLELTSYSIKSLGRKSD
jgi:hypothetical protein